MLTWQYATPDDFGAVAHLFVKSGLGAGFAEISRRVTIPILLGQLIAFYDKKGMCGFVSYAFLTEEAGKTMAVTGISVDAWRAGDRFWAVDFAAAPEYDGFKMLRMVTRDLGVKKARYFRKKAQQIKEVRVI